jgi:hypothetical protein
MTFIGCARAIPAALILLRLRQMLLPSRIVREWTYGLPCGIPSMGYETPVDHRFGMCARNASAAA